MRYHEIMEGEVIDFPGKKASEVLPSALDGFVDFMRDPRPIHDVYAKGDVLLLNGRIADVIKATSDSLVLKFRDDGRTEIVPRRSPGLDVAPVEDW